LYGVFIGPPPSVYNNYFHFIIRKVKPKKNLIEIILKIGGLYVLLQIIAANSITITSMLFNLINYEILVYLVSSILIVSLILYFFVLRTDIILSIMKIDPYYLRILTLINPIFYP